MARLRRQAEKTTMVHRVGLGIRGYLRRLRFADWTGIESELTLDKDDIRRLAGTMGRFPGFQRTGWQILGSAKIVARD